MYKSTSTSENVSTIPPKPNSTVQLDFTTNKLKITLKTPIGTFEGMISYFGPHGRVTAEGCFDYKVDFGTILTISTANFYADGNIKDHGLSGRPANKVVSIDINKDDTKVGEFNGTVKYDVPDYIFVGSVTLTLAEPGRIWPKSSKNYIPWNINAQAIADEQADQGI